MLKVEPFRNRMFLKGFPAVFSALWHTSKCMFQLQPQTNSWKNKWALTFSTTFMSSVWKISRSKSDESLCHVKDRVCAGKSGFRVKPWGTGSSPTPVTLQRGRRDMTKGYVSFVKYRHIIIMNQSSCKMWLFYPLRLLVVRWCKVILRFQSK